MTAEKSNPEMQRRQNSESLFSLLFPEIIYEEKTELQPLRVTESDCFSALCKVAFIPLCYRIFFSFFDNLVLLKTAAL